MSQNRTDLNFENHNGTYIVLTIILVILSILGGYLFFRLQSPPKTVDLVLPSPSPSPSTIATETVEPTMVPTTIPTASPSAKPILKPTSLPTPETTVVPSAVPTPIPETLNFSSTVDNFSVDYSHNRKLYQDQEATGNRYTFYSSKGNFAIHVGSKWSWTYPNRDFTDSLLISGHNTFVYSIKTQTIYDLENGDQKFTIQCVHNGLDDLKAECDHFVASFKLL